MRNARRNVTSRPVTDTLPYTQAHQTFDRAMAMVQKLAAKMEDEARRSNFLAEAAVRRVLERG